MSGHKKEIRELFRSVVFRRDKYTCVKCGLKATPQTAEEILDAHHITNRNDMPNGGYVLQNGISLCKVKCHLLAEEDLQNVQKRPGFSRDDLYRAIKSSFDEALKASQNLSK